MESIPWVRCASGNVLWFLCISSTFQMCPQSVFTRECILALVAFVWFFSTVRFQMCPQNVCPRGAIVALVHFQFNLRTHLKTHSGEKSNNHCILWPLINHMVWHNGIFLNFLEHLKIHGSIWDFTGASEILLERLWFYWSVWEPAWVLEILMEHLRFFGASVESMVPKKCLLEKTLPSVCTYRIGVQCLR